MAAVASGVPEEMALMTGTWMTDTDVVAVVVAVALAVLAGFFGWRAFAHHSDDLKPALVTPDMNVHDEFSNDLSARIYRLQRGRDYGNRENRPKLIALTFDDGPYPIFTPLLLDRLHDLGVPATFFLIGRDAHPNLDQESDATVRDEIERGRDALWAIAPDPAERDLMRPPHGRYTLGTLQVAQGLGYRVVLWTDDSGDWRTISSERIQRHMLSYATAPEIVLLHSGKLATIDALPEVVRRFRAAGYRFVTVGELMRQVPADVINHPAHRALGD